MASTLLEFVATLEKNKPDPELPAPLHDDSVSSFFSVFSSDSFVTVPKIFALWPVTRSPIFCPNTKPDPEESVAAFTLNKLDFGSAPPELAEPLNFASGSKFSSFFSGPASFPSTLLGESSSLLNPLMKGFVKSDPELELLDSPSLSFVPALVCDGELLLLLLPGVLLDGAADAEEDAANGDVTVNWLGFNLNVFSESEVFPEFNWNCDGRSILRFEEISYFIT